MAGLFSMIRTLCEEEGQDSGGETSKDLNWLRNLSEGEIIRFIRARSQNIYGHNWRLQALNYDDPFLVEHACWRHDRGYHLDSFTSARASTKSTVWRWSEGESRPVLSLDLGTAQPDSLSFEEILDGFADACEMGRREQNVGIKTQADLILNVRPNSSGEGQSDLLIKLMQHVITMLNPIHIATYPPAVMQASFLRLLIMLSGFRARAFPRIVQEDLCKWNELNAHALLRRLKGSKL
eukprot:394667-Hanusia_phi.AAC.1